MITVCPNKKTQKKQRFKVKCNFSYPKLKINEHLS